MAVGVPEIIPVPSDTSTPTTTVVVDSAVHSAKQLVSVNGMFARIPATTVFSRSLSVGTQGIDVEVLQVILEQKGLLIIPAGVAKGYFGSLTQEAVIKYQKKSNLPSVGVFGPLTKAKLISETIGN